MNPWTNEHTDHCADNVPHPFIPPSAPLGAFAENDQQSFDAQPDPAPSSAEPPATDQPWGAPDETAFAAPSREDPGSWDAPPAELPAVTWMPAVSAGEARLAPIPPPAPASPVRRDGVRRATVVALVLASFVGGSLGGGAVGSLITLREPPAGSAAQASPAQLQPIIQRSAASDTSAIFQATSPAVVEIATSTQDRWGRAIGAGTGSGFVVDPSGLILTNQHVIAGAGDELAATLRARATEG